MSIALFRYEFFVVDLQDADQVERLNESGELRQLLKQYKVCVKKFALKSDSTLAQQVCMCCDQAMFYIFLLSILSISFLFCGISIMLM